ncbi:MAG: hypothetical protein HY903_05450 [Deltaproteobacteria bacterium]|nr:hypothetical protein [Deltaproteobacteria bacterium]
MRWSRYAVVALSLFLAHCSNETSSGRFCYGDGLCVEADGAIVDVNGKPRDGGDQTVGDSGPGDLGGDDSGPVQPVCVCAPSGTDQDGDCIADTLETAHGNSDPTKPDTDGDGVGDGCEDRNQDGVRQSSEMDPQRTDTDSDLIPDGLEDANHNGRFDAGETSALRADTDFDGIADGTEDKNHNGAVDMWAAHDPLTDLNDNGCFDLGEPTETNPRPGDTDNDGMADDSEDRNKNGVCDLGETCAGVADTDCDLLADGKEDRNHNGQINSNETDPLNPDTDGDGIPDGVEDENRNGNWDIGTETSPQRLDTDGDGILDGVEDANHNGRVDPFTDLNGNGAWDDGEAGGESNPRLADGDGDGIPDGIEDGDKDGTCATRYELDPYGSGATVRALVETCAFLLDSDGDGIPDGTEDANRDGRHDIGETDPRYRDSDFDGLSDGCPLGADPKTCEDKNNNGIPESGETSPLTADSDGDSLSDGCEVRFDPINCTTADCSIDPLSEDTDGDGYADGEEDLNHNCVFEESLGEKDPRVFNPAPDFGTPDRAVYNVCATQNLKPLTFASSNRLTHDYKLAFEVEYDDAAATNQKAYDVRPYGKDLNGGGFQVADPADALFGHAFQSPKEVWDPALAQVTNRDVYGFIAVTTTAGSVTLEDALVALRAAIETALEPGSTNLTSLPGEGTRTAHDDAPTFRIDRAQLKDRLHLGGTGVKHSALAVRNTILRAALTAFDPNALGVGTACPIGDECAPGDICVNGACESAMPANVLQQDIDATGAAMPITCPTSPLCHNDFSLEIEGVMRLDRKTRLGNDGQIVLDQTAGQPELVFVVALTPDESAAGGPAARLHEDQLTRLDDLTGGSALARFAAETSKTCEKKPQQKARADVLWVVDDSRSMQQIIVRLQKAAAAAQAVLTANSEIVDYRVAMTTTNGSVGYRAECMAQCAGTCCGPTGACTGAAGTSAGDCEIGCVSQAMDCLKVCPTALDGKPCYDGCSGGRCTCVSASTASVTVCPGTGAGDPYCAPGTECIDPTAVDAQLALDSGYVNAASEPLPSVTPISKHAMPGGGGTFYFEDSDYLDCKADATGSSTQRQTQFVNSCAAVASFANFFNGGARKQLLADGGFLGNAAGAGCATAAMDLLYDVTASSPPSACANDPSRYCQRLTAACADGPTVLASQMCDVIRAMGGLPCDLPAGRTNGTRPHSAPEYGSRSARRLLTKLIPALPLDYSGGLDPKLHLRLNCHLAASGRLCPSGTDLECDPYERCVSGVCQPNGNCPANGCDPSQAAIDGASGITVCADDGDCWSGEFCGTDRRCKRDCSLVPVATVFLSDEEDFYLKDECRTRPEYTPGQSGWEPNARAQTDLWELPDACYWADGDPTTAEVCTPAYCDAQAFLSGWPQSASGMYDPDTAAHAEGGDITMRWRPADAPECSAAFANRETTCVGDPCAANYRDSTACAEWSVGFTDGNGAAHPPTCTWTGSFCVNKCTNYTRTPPVDANDRADQKNRCDTDPDCRWEQWRVRTGGDQTQACVLKRPPNDCQPCKRLRRTLEAITGGDGLIGLGAVGPAYAITRPKGVQGYGLFNGTTQSSEDGCKGGSVTWSRGDGQAYRDLVSGTFGRSQDICTNGADGFHPFVQELIGDMAALSAPYRLLAAPIAATLKVGIARPNGAVVDYFEVPRSRTAGFSYNSTTNSIGFRSNPVDGVCGGGACSANGVIEQSEITYAQTAPHVPRQNDLVIISYRFWLPVPCDCPEGQSCVPFTCPAQPPVPTACNTDVDCLAFGQKCLNLQCLYDCAQGQRAGVCVCGNCGACEVCDAANGSCRLSTTNPCDCDPRETQCAEEQLESTCYALTVGGVRPCAWDATQNKCVLGERCQQSGTGACRPGYVCDESCVCLPLPTCDAGFNPDGSVKSCTDALTCCSDWQAAEAACPTKTVSNCSTTPRCAWNSTIGVCESEAPACCLADETAECWTNPETGEGRIICVAKPLCECARPSTAGCDPSLEVDVGGQCFCNAETAYCCKDCFNADGNPCACRPVPP